MDVATAIGGGRSLLQLGQEIASIVKKAKASPEVTRRVLLYLESAQAAVSALGLERQHILSDVRRCDVRRANQVAAVWTRLDRYLHEDNIRPQLERSIEGLGACREPVARQAKGLCWRKRDKEAAVAAFATTLDELESTLRRLTSNFYPGGSGMGVQTLVPIFDLLGEVRSRSKSRQADAAELESFDEKLAELARQALRDASHEEWIRTTAQVERLIAELQLAFAVPGSEAEFAAPEKAGS